jgi:hypothetical protein
MLDQKLIAINLLPEDRVALGILVSGVKAQFSKDMVNFSAGKDFEVARQYLQWIYDTARIYSTASLTAKG